MAKVTNFRMIDVDGKARPCDAFGNNVAFSCPNCSHPMLATIRPNGRGSDKEHRVICRGCDLEAYINVKAEEHSLWVRWPKAPKAN